jgi:hypothetical protein
MPLLTSLPEILAILASVVETSMLLVEVDSRMVVATVAPFLADMVSHLVDAVVASTSILML